MTKYLNSSFSSMPATDAYRDGWERTFSQKIQIKKILEEQELEKILEEHKKWLDGEGGKKADLSGANLNGADLRGANLRGANLCGADFSRADLRETDLRGADLSKAKLRGANLSKANFSEADLRKADLREADLCGANLRKANLRGADLYWTIFCRANLSGADLYGAKLRGANLSETLLNKTNLANTVLDPKNILSNPSTFEIEKAGMQVSDNGKYILAWRTYKSISVGNTQYNSGTYEAPVFSSCTETKCHPGLYFASKEWLMEHYSENEFVQVRVPIENNVVHAGDKWRCRKFEVLGKIE